MDSIRISKKQKSNKESVIKLADKLGYEVDVIGSAIYLVKGDKRSLKKSYRQAYQFLYMKEYRMNNKSK
jgi:hypothetical protein